MEGKNDGEKVVLIQVVQLGSMRGTIQMMDRTDSDGGQMVQAMQVHQPPMKYLWNVPAKQG